MANRGGRRRPDHLTTWLAVTPILIYGLISMGAFFALMTPGRGGAQFGLVLIPGVGALYGAAAILQLQYGLIKSWRPAWGQGLALAWFGGWALFITGRLIGDFRSGGLSAVGEFVFDWILLAFLVSLPWLLALLMRSVRASLRSRSRRLR